MMGLVDLRVSLSKCTRGLDELDSARNKVGIKMLYVCIIIMTIALCYIPNAMLIMSTLVLYLEVR